MPAQTDAGPNLTGCLHIYSTTRGANSQAKQNQRRKFCYDGIVENYEKCTALEQTAK
jgi:hypothetical protein